MIIESLLDLFNNFFPALKIYTLDKKRLQITRVIISLIKNKYLQEFYLFKFNDINFQLTCIICRYIFIHMDTDYDLFLPLSYLISYECIYVFFFYLSPSLLFGLCRCSGLSGTPDTSRSIQSQFARRRVKSELHSLDN